MPNRHLNYFPLLRKLFSSKRNFLFFVIFFSWYSPITLSFSTAVKLSTDSNASQGLLPGFALALHRGLGLNIAFPCKPSRLPRR
ncbi:protein of unknown function [Pararobbsia alpina]